MGRLAALLTCTAAVLSGCGGEGGGGPARERLLGSMTQGAALGEKIFHDVSLSASGKLSCASCHNPDKLGAGIDNISGATLSCTHVTDGVRRVAAIGQVALAR